MTHTTEQGIGPVELSDAIQNSIQANAQANPQAVQSALTALDDLGIDTASANSAYFDYLTANAETKVGALTNAITAINTTIDTAIEQQVAGADTSALTALKAQLESALSAAGQGQTETLMQTNTAATEQVMSDAVSELLKLPATLQDQTNVEAARQAYFDYLTASPEGKTAAYEEAVKLLGESAEAALEAEGLGAGTREALQTLLDDIDSEGRVGDNGAVNAGTFNFNRYLRTEIGNPPADMVDPHAHHILFKEGLGDAQKALVKEGQALLRRYGIDPIRGLENLVWAPNRIAGQHDIAALRNVVEQLKAVEELGGDFDFIRNQLVIELKRLGRLAATRR